jgi:ABC-type transport system involved in cytochrome bd biosynthesis fused ATPase/permease subunit
VLLADEPAAHLDPATADAVTGLIMRPGPDRCVVLVSHRPADAALGDVVLHLDRGRMSRSVEVNPATTGSG